jgi:hypothetical protein
LDVHHRNYERLGHESPHDLQVLCRGTCHPIADSHRIEQVNIRRINRQTDAARDTFLSKKYGDNFASFADASMHEEFERWRSRKNYEETGLYDPDTL